MALVAREGSYNVIVWPNDHPPPHAHVYAGDLEWRVELGADASGVRLMSESKDVLASKTLTAVELVRQHREQCAALWRRFRG